MQKKRPVGVILIGWFCIIISLLPILLGILNIGSGFKHARLFYRIMLPYIIIPIFTGVGLIRLKNYARILAMVIFIILSVSFGVSAVGYILTGQHLAPDRMHSAKGLFYFIVSLVVLALCIFITVYLARPKVKQAFTERNPEQSEA